MSTVWAITKALVLAALLLTWGAFSGVCSFAFAWASDHGVTLRDVLEFTGLQVAGTAVVWAVGRWAIPKAPRPLAPCLALVSTLWMPALLISSIIR